MGGGRQYSMKSTGKEVRWKVWERWQGRNCAGTLPLA